MPDIDQLIEDLSQRIATTESDSGTSLTVPDAIKTISRLTAIVADNRDTSDVRILTAMALLVVSHWIRYQLLPEGEDQEDLQACLMWSTAIFPIAPEAVPEPIRAHLADASDQATHNVSDGYTAFNEYQRTGNVAYIDAAVALFQEELTATPPDHPDRPAMLSNLGSALSTRFERTGQLGDLDDAIATGREAVTTTPPDHPNRPGRLSNLGVALSTRFERTGQLGDLDDAIATGREAVTTTPPDHPDRPMYLSNLGSALRIRFERTGQLGDLDDAIATGREAVTTTPPDHPDRPMYLSNLGVALRIRFERTGQLGDLDDAIATGREAVTTTPPDHPNRPAMLSNLGVALRIRFERTGQLGDLDDAIATGREAVTTTPPDHPDRPGRLSNLGVALRIRFERTGQLGDLDDAIATGREAVTTTPPDHPNRPMYLSNLGVALSTRFERTGQLGDLDDAIATGREAVTTTPPDNPGRPGRLSNLGSALSTRFDRTGQLSDLNDAIDTGREAVTITPPDHPDRPMYLSNLGGALRTRFERTGQLSDLNDAIATSRDAATTGTGTPILRLRAARRWGGWALLASDRRDAYELAVAKLLPLVVWHGLDRATLEHHLREFGGLGAEAAAAAVGVGDTTRAIELGEQGRALLWTQALNLRQDLVALRERDPELAARLEKARAFLDGPGSSGGNAHLVEFPQGESADELRAAQQQMLDKRRRAATEWDGALKQVHQLENFEDFLRPAPFNTLRQAAANGPVVIVNISRSASHALIVTSQQNANFHDGPVHVIDLPEATWQSTIDRANALLEVQHRYSDRKTDTAARELDRHTAFDVLEWTWRAIVGPVLSALGYTDAPDPTQPWPRVWWCPTGPAAFLPLHAAGIHPRTEIQRTQMGETAAIAETTAGRVISSYTPTLDALIRAQSRPGAEPMNALIVGVSDAPGQAPLPGVAPEMEAVAAALPAGVATYLGSRSDAVPISGTPTRKTVMSAITEHSWLHLSCHASQHPADPYRSAFALRDTALTVEQLVDLDLPDADLAYLAACQTATGDTGLIDEALHLSAALQLVGYRHVLATMWPISDAAAPSMAHMIYSRLVHADPDNPQPDDRPESDRAAHALHHATAALRQAYPGEPLLWAPYIHFGP